MDESDLARERLARLQARNDRRRAQGKPTWGFDEGALPSGAETDSSSIADPDQSTMVLTETLLRRTETAEPERRRIAVSTAIFAAATGLSRVLGLIRQVVVAYFFGTTGLINAFTVAYQLPNLVANLAASSALQSAFVPVFSDLIEKGDRRRAWRVASSLFWLMLLGLTALTALLILVAPWIIDIFGNPGHDRALAVGLSRVLFPLVMLLGVGGVVVGILNTYDHFTVPALSPVFWNIAIIIGLAIGVQHHRTGPAPRDLYVYAAAVLVATVIQVLLPFPWLRGLERGEERLRVVLDWRDPAVRRVFKLMLPVTLGVGLINVNALIDTFFASRLIDANASPAEIQNAFLIYMFPQGMFSVAIATVLFPRLSRLASRGDMDGFGDTVSTGIRQIAFMLAPMAVVSAVLAEPIVRILYQRGQWHPGQTPEVAFTLAAFSAGLVVNGTMLMFNRAFFSLQDNWTPTVVALGNLFANALLDLAFYRLGTWGIALSTSVVNVGGTVALAIMLRRRLGSFGGGRITGAVTKIVLACTPVAAVSYVVWKPLDSVLGRTFPAQVVSLGAALVAATAVYLAACSVLKVAEMQALLSLRGRLGRGRVT